MTPKQLRQFDAICDRLGELHRRWTEAQKKNDEITSQLREMVKGASGPDIRPKYQRLCDHLISERLAYGDFVKVIHGIDREIEYMTHRAYRRERDKAERPRANV